MEPRVTTYGGRSLLRSFSTAISRDGDHIRREATDISPTENYRGRRHESLKSSFVEYFFIAIARLYVYRVAIHVGWYSAREKPISRVATFATDEKTWGTRSVIYGLYAIQMKLLYISDETDRQQWKRYLLSRSTLIAY